MKTKGSKKTVLFNVRLPAELVASCGKEINPAAMLGSITSPAKAKAARKNAKLGGWPKGKKRKP